MYFVDAAAGFHCRAHGVQRASRHTPVRSSLGRARADRTKAKSKTPTTPERPRQAGELTGWVPPHGARVVPGGPWRSDLLSSGPSSTTPSLPTQILPRPDPPPPYRPLDSLVGLDRVSYYCFGVFLYTIYPILPARLPSRGQGASLSHILPSPSFLPPSASHSLRP
jgi:hypothetical protein